MRQYLWDGSIARERMKRTTLIAFVIASFLMNGCANKCERAAIAKTAQTQMLGMCARSRATRFSSISSPATTTRS
jgi:hypothetical protein